MSLALSLVGGVRQTIPSARPRRRCIRLRTSRVPLSNARAIQRTDRGAAFFRVSCRISKFTHSHRGLERCQNGASMRSAASTISERGDP
jgi:hypothetical protein